MARPRVMTVYGTRPEAIKVAPVVEALGADGEVEHVCVVTGQHRAMLDQVNELFGIVPDRDLYIIEPGQSLAQMSAKVFDRFDPVLEEFAPDAIMVQGDTTTVAIAAIAAFYRQIKVIHLEAGLRSGDLYSPFPEEANRRITSQITALHLAPTAESKANLLREGVAESDIAVTGNTVIDALVAAVGRETPFDDPRLEAACASGRPLIVVTTHRRENWGEAMEGIGRALRAITAAHPEVIMVLPLHLNPIVRRAVLPHVEGVEQILVSDPLSYGQFSRLLAAAHLIVTDSGGVQEEAPSLGKPVLVLRENTERPEAVHAGTVKLIGTTQQRIIDEVTRLLTDPAAYAAMANAVNPYGDGHATARVTAAIKHLLGIGQRLPDFKPQG